MSDQNPNPRRVIKLVTAMTFYSQEGALVGQMILRDQGIHCVLADYHTLLAVPYLDVALGGIKLMVAAPDLQAAAQELKPLQAVRQRKREATNVDHAGRFAALYWWCPILMNLLSLAWLCRHWMGRGQTQSPSPMRVGSILAANALVLAAYLIGFLSPIGMPQCAPWIERDDLVCVMDSSEMNAERPIQLPA